MPFLIILTVSLHSLFVPLAYRPSKLDSIVELPWVKQVKTGTEVDIQYRKLFLLKYLF